MEIRSFREADEAEVIALWEVCGLLRSWNDPARDIARKRLVQPELFRVALKGDEIVASAMSGFEGHRGWVNYLAVSPAHRGEGLGRAMMLDAEQLLLAAGCPKLNLQVRGTNEQALGFYRSIGYEIDDVVSLGKRLELDEPG